MKYILASASPRRKELLGLVVPEFEIITANIEETCPESVLPENRPEYLALKKAEHIAKSHPESVVIGADTAVFLGDTMLGKPTDEADAEKMLKALSGRTHKVITGCAIVSKEKEVSFSVVSEVTFYDLSNGEIKEYVKTKEPLDKAGAYGIQGKGALLVKEIKGDYFNIVGLPVAELKRRLPACGAETPKE
ncbi:MAG: septum formation protein Maf [Clostridia bacterium]|nr:septum formation protein Maf [Clostridia bacterium]